MNSRNAGLGLESNADGLAFEVGLRHGDAGPSFARQLPVFNWFYPFDVEKQPVPRTLAAVTSIDWDAIRRCAVYVHVPFCETICTFCPFVRGHYQTDEDIESYLVALLREFQLKRPFIGRPRVDSIFVGGGTPSVLSPAQISRLGEYLHAYLDTSQILEFSVEVEVKSATYEKLAALRDIGVTRVSFGAQTFSERHRSAFGLDAPISQIARVASWANNLFPYTNVDVIYGIAGEDVEGAVRDADSAIELSTTSVDFYPLNNLAAQPRMHRAFEGQGLQRPSAFQRLQQRRMLRDHMSSRGYARINGYGFALRHSESGNIVQSSPRFLYHDILYGYDDDVVLGYGASSVTQVPGYNVYNVGSRGQYREMLVDHRTLPCAAYSTGSSSEKGIVTFPYRGMLEKTRVRWNAVNHETLHSLDRLLDAGFVSEIGHAFQVTEAGWLYYVNLMYYLMPSHAKRCISQEIVARVAAGHEYEDTALAAP